MPTNSKKKPSWLRKVVTNQKKRIDGFMARRPHRSFQLSRRRDYIRPLELPGNVSFTVEVTRTLWKYKNIFGALALVYAALSIVLVGLQSQETYGTLSDTLRGLSSNVFEGDISALGQAGIVFASIFTSGATGGATEVQQLLAVLLFLMVFLATVWLLRNLLAGHKVKLRDGLYNSGAPIFAMIVVAIVIIVQLIPVLIAVVGYTAAAATGLIEAGGAPAMAFWVAAALLAILSLFWVTSSLFAMIIVTLPGMYPFRALKTAGDIVLGRRIKILLRWLWMLLVVLVAWAVILIPVILIDMGLKSLWPAIDWLPIVPFVMLFTATASTIWISGYIYLLYRKVVDYAPKS